MTDLLTATQDAFYALLAAVPGNALGAVVQHVPEDAQPPLTVVGRIEASNIAGKDGGLEQHAVEVVYSYRGTQRRQLYAMMHAGRTAIETGPLTASGAVFDIAVWQTSETDIAEDGVTYQGVQTFQVIVQPDD